MLDVGSEYKKFKVEVEEVKVEVEEVKVEVEKDKVEVEEGEEVVEVEEVEEVEEVPVPLQLQVGNRAQRCDCHKLAVVWWEGGMRSYVQISCLSPFWTRMFLREF